MGPLIETCLEVAERLQVCALVRDDPTLVDLIDRHGSEVVPLLAPPPHHDDEEPLRAARGACSPPGTSEPGVHRARPKFGGCTRAAGSTATGGSDRQAP